MRRFADALDGDLELAFDHQRILSDAVDRAADDSDDTDLATLVGVMGRVAVPVRSFPSAWPPSRRPASPGVTLDAMVLVSLVSILKRFYKVMQAGWDDAEFRGLSIVLGSWVALGTIIYSLREGWNIVDSLYFSVMTLTTIGYGDLAPTSSGMRLYTVVYAVMGIGLFVAFNARLAQFAFQGQSRDDAEQEEETGPS